MWEKLKCILIVSLVLSGTVSLPANEAAIRKTITDCAAEAASMRTSVFNYWCTDGTLTWNGSKYYLHEMKQKFCPVIEDNNAWDYDSLINIRAAGGRLSDSEKSQALSINRFKKKAKYAIMKSEVKAEYLAWKSITGYIQSSLRLHSVEINGNQAQVRVSVTNPKTFKPVTCTIKMKKINGAWKIHAVE